MTDPAPPVPGASYAAHQPLTVIAHQWTGAFQEAPLPEWLQALFDKGVIITFQEPTHSDPLAQYQWVKRADGRIARPGDWLIQTCRDGSEPGIMEDALFRICFSTFERGRMQEPRPEPVNQEEPEHHHILRHARRTIIGLRNRVDELEPRAHAYDTIAHLTRARDPNERRGFSAEIDPVFRIDEYFQEKGQ